jgi:hypothetical protein
VRSLWAYAYEIVPPQPSRRLGTIRTLIEGETAAAHGRSRAWSARLVLGRRSTHILIVSDFRARNRAINHQLEAELERLEAPFSVTAPLAVVGHAAGVKWLATYEGNGR